MMGIFGPTPDVGMTGLSHGRYYREEPSVSCRRDLLVFDHFSESTYREARRRRIVHAA